MTNSIRLKIKTMYKDFSAKEQTIADYIIENPTIVSHSSISDLSAQTWDSRLYIFSIHQKLGFNGFKEFKMELLKQENDFVSISIHENIKKMTMN